MRLLTIRSSSTRSPCLRALELTPSRSARHRIDCTLGICRRRRQSSELWPRCRGRGCWRDEVDAVEEAGSPVAGGGALGRDRAEERCGLGQQDRPAALGMLREVDQGLAAFRVDLLRGEVVQRWRVVGAALLDEVTAPVDRALDPALGTHPGLMCPLREASLSPRDGRPKILQPPRQPRHRPARSSSVGNPGCGRGDSNPHGVATNRT
jgi:hypothetical protein